MISPNRWCILFLFFYQRLNRVCLLRFSSQKVRWARRWKNVPIFLKRNWIHKSVDGRKAQNEGAPPVLCTLLFFFSCVSKPKGCLTRGEKKSESAKRYFLQDSVSLPSLDFTFTLDLLDEVYSPPLRLSTIKNIRLSTSKSIVEKDYSCQRFCFLSFSMVNNPRIFVLVDRIVDLKRDIHRLKILLFQKVARIR